jgi:hypothetical protein
VTPWTTNNKITDEYNGFVLSRGVAVMVGINTLTVGVGAGWEYLIGTKESGAQLCYPTTP